MEVTQEQYEAGALRGTDTLLVVYAPWCPFCQRMEPEFARLAAAAPPGLRLAKLRGDTVRDFARGRLGVQSFPTVLALRGGAGEPKKYESEERGAEQLLKFANAAMGAAHAMRS